MRRLGEPQRKMMRQDEQLGKPPLKLEGKLGDQATNAQGRDQQGDNGRVTEEHKVKQERESGAQRRMRKATTGKPGTEEKSKEGRGRER